MPRDKIILINVQDYGPDEPNGAVGEDCSVPLGILHLGSALYNKGFKVRLLDTRLKSRENFLRLLDEELPDAFLAGFSVMTPHVGEALRISRYAKEKFPHLAIVWGGIHPSLFPESTVINKYIDFVIVKEGERPLLELSGYLLHKKCKAGEIPNLVYKEGSGILKNPLIDTEGEAGELRYELLAIERYLLRKAESGQVRRQLEVLGSRGCPHHCSFCINTVLYKNRWYGYPIKETLKVIDRLIQEYAVEHIFFMDEDFFCSRQRAADLISEMAKRKVSWECNCRADYIREDYINGALLQRLRKSGCVKLRFGLESGSQRVLDMLTKGLTVAQSVRAVKEVTKHGIVPSVSFMMGVPGEENSDIIKTCGLIAKLYFINPHMHLIPPSLFRPYPGGELFQKCVAMGLKVPGELGEWGSFYINNTADLCNKGLPWFKDTNIFRKVNLFVGHIYCGRNSFIGRMVIFFLLRVHLLTGLKLVGITYACYRAGRSVPRFFHSRTHPLALTR
jgi:anaerobic magnesium-protoporphyrin IX monomethyl ester cyclase